MDDESNKTYAKLFNIHGNVKLLDVVHNDACNVLCLGLL